jgi:hypothetical protein
MKREYDPPLDPGIADAVEALQDAGIETFESCESGPGHAYPEPAVRFHGQQPEGMRALSAALSPGHLTCCAVLHTGVSLCTC